MTYGRQDTTCKDLGLPTTQAGRINFLAPAPPRAVIFKTKPELVANSVLCFFACCLADHPVSWERRSLGPTSRPSFRTRGEAAPTQSSRLRSTCECRSSGTLMA